ncbi:uncharacterized protein LOC123258691 [Cotesia glomerata]|uniref:uncharacterized protein LOC123258691 n=1 Tax=Cotesia glomerata TaxID=32391 RepID=UPI001D00D5D5|nr:uncharacterized protein LOC123258691 [Cotesia glomerata]
MSDQIDKFCLVQNGKDAWIVETKFVFKAGTDGNHVPIDLNEEEDQTCFVKTETRQINNVIVVGSSDDATTLKNNYFGGPTRIRTLKITPYSPGIPNNGKSQQKPTTKTSQASSQLKKTQHSAKHFRDLLPPGNRDSSSDKAEQTHDNAILDGHDPGDQDDGDVNTTMGYDENSESNANPRRRTVPSPPLRNDTFETVRGRSARLSGTGSSSENNERRSRRVNSVIRRPLRSRLNMTKKIKSLERSVNSLTKTVQKILKKVGQGKDNVTQETYPELEQRVIVEGENEDEAGKE